MKYLITFSTDIVNQEQAPEWGIDKVLTNDVVKNDLLNLPQDKETLAFFVPTVFDYNNSLSYEGAILALRILMHYIRNGRTDIDIILMGNETESNFLLHYDYPNILKIPNFHYIRFNKKTVALYQLPQREQLKVDEYKPFLDNLGVRIPSSFKSTHSLTNEWCLYKWNSFMGFNENSSALDGHLYFDYLITIEKLNRIKIKTASTYLKERIQNFPENLPNARILLIDDKDGWHHFFQDMFSNTAKVKLHCLGEDFNKLDFAEIEKSIIDEVNDFNPHIIILDFRLMEDKDAEIKDNMKEISGYKVLANILKGTYNSPLKSFGKQVLIFTATSRIENILMLREANADGFIIKEKPENYNGKEITKDVISKMISTMETAIKRANFLIPLNEKLDELLNIVNITNNRETNIGNTINIASQSVRQLTQNNPLNKDVLKLVFLNLFSILEALKDKDNETKGENDKLNSYINKKCSEIKLDSGTFSLWDNINQARNSLAHGNSVIRKGKYKGENVSANLLLDLTIFILEFMKLYLKR